MAALRLLIFLGGLLVLTPVAVNAKISVHTDGGGKVHISNHGADSIEPLPAPGSMVPEPPRGRLPAPPPPSLEREQPEEPLPPQTGRQKASLQESPGQIRPAAYKKSSQKIRSAGRSRANRAKRVTTPSIDAGSIRIGLNGQGVLCITNLPEKEPGLALAEALPEHPRSSPPIPDTPVAWEEIPLAGQIIPAAHRPKPKTSQTFVLEEGPIRRQRDNRGVIRISNVEVAIRKTNQPALAALPPRPESAPRLQTVPAQPPPLQPGQQLRTVAVRRDPKGRLQIYTKEPDVPLLASRPATPALDRLDPALAPIVNEAASTYRLPPSLILSVIRMESNFSPGAVSPKGAMGLMQLMPGTAADLGVQDPFCPRQNILGGSRYLRQMLNCFDGSVPLAVAAYNAGPHRVASAGNQIPEIKETKKFVSSVLGLYTLLEKMSPGPRP
jgi:hypothetical protein